MNKSVTMKNIADVIGVSTVTVSKALADKEGVGEELRQAIKEKADEMGYNYAASKQKSLKEKQKFKVTYIDGVESERELLSSKTLVPVQNKIIAYGVYMNFNEPYGLNYAKKITDVKAVSYHFSGNPKGAYGKPCTYGTCAVDPKVIPLGSLIYIEGYGYAVANDVGTGIKGNIVDVYMEYGPQCYTWGARTVDVYLIY